MGEAGRGREDGSARAGRRGATPGRCALGGGRAAQGRGATRRQQTERARRRRGASDLLASVALAGVLAVGAWTRTAAREGAILTHLSECEGTPPRSPGLVSGIISTPPVGTGRTPPGEVRLVVDTAARTLTVYSEGQVFTRFPVAVGKPSTPSPAGEWAVVEKSRWGGGFGTRWMGLNVPWGKYGIHGTNKPGSIGHAVSGGCIRMHNRNVEELFRWVKVGTPVKIVGPSSPYSTRETYRRGASGRDVVALQLSLRELGFVPGMADGRYGEVTAGAVASLEDFYGLPVDGEADADVQNISGFRRK